MGDTAAATVVELEYVVTLDQLLLAFSWAADEAGYDLDETNTAAQLIVRAWRTVATRGAWQRPGEPAVRPAPLTLDQVTEIIPVVVVAGEPAPAAS